jgi:hypothetical protein
LAVVLVGLAGAAWAQGGMTVAHGVICEVEITGRREAPETESGQMNMIDGERAFDVVTDVVPAVPGLSFGIRATVAGEDAVVARLEVLHPPMGARGVTSQAWDVTLYPGEASLNLFTFEHEYERVPGAWAFRLTDGETVLAEQRFTVLNGIPVPAVERVCFGTMPMS